LPVLAIATNRLGIEKDIEIESIGTRHRTHVPRILEERRAIGKYSQTADTHRAGKADSSEAIGSVRLQMRRKDECHKGSCDHQPKAGRSRIIPQYKRINWRIGRKKPRSRKAQIQPVTRQ